MRKFVWAIILSCVLSVSVVAQEHLTFKDVPIDGKLTSFVSVLKTKGFSSTEVGDDNAIMRGKFGGQECQILIYASPISKIVYQVIAIVEESNSWTTLKSAYFDYKSSLTKKYGKGESVESFQSPYYEGDGYELSALRNHKCYYGTSFSGQNGEISVALAYLNSGIVMLSYKDSLNGNRASREEDNMRSNDL